MRRRIPALIAGICLVFCAQSQAANTHQGRALSIRTAHRAAIDWAATITTAGVIADGCHHEASRLTVYCSVQTKQEIDGEIYVLPVVVRLMPARRLIYVTYENARVPFYEDSDVAGASLTFKRTPTVR